MALRIGFLILASCNLLNGNLLKINENTFAAARPTVSFPTQSHEEHQSQDDGPGPQLGSKLAPLGYNGQKKESEEHSKPTVVVVQKNPVVVIQKQPVVVGHKPVTVTVQAKPVPVIHGPKPSVVISNYVIGDSPVHEKVRVFDDDHINVNKTPVNFKPLKYVDNDDQKVQIPISVVTVPEISTAKPTKHTVAPNQVIDRSNIPSVKEYRNRLADELMYSYTGIFAKIQPITQVHDQPKTPVPAPVKSPLVKPGKLQNIVQAQLAVGELYQNAPIVIQNFLTTDEHGQQFDHDEHERPVVFFEHGKSKGH